MHGNLQLCIHWIVSPLAIMPSTIMATPPEATVDKATGKKLENQVQGIADHLREALEAITCVLSMYHLYTRLTSDLAT